jgi:actin related protein 2/3 complex subunit 1A/1B
MEHHQLFLMPITTFAFNGDRSRLAVVPNGEVIVLYKRTGKTWVVDTELKGHDQRVTSIDWAPNSNRIVSCSQDRNAFVWTEEEDKSWKPTLVILRINRAATHVRWSPKEDKFAVASGARLISVCYFEEDNDWWVSKHIKKPIRSTVLSLDWHPNNVLLVAGSSDFRCRVFSGYIKGVDQKPAATPWGKKMTFGECMADFANGHGGWVHDCAFSPSGDRVAFVGHDSSVSVVDANKSSEVPETTLTKGLPFRAVLWVSETSFVVAGYDCYPQLFKVGDDGKPVYVDRLEQVKQKKDTGRALSAMNKFKELDTRAQSTGDASSETTLETTHQNAISQISALSRDDAGNAVMIASSGMDGQLVLWDLNALPIKIE